jgi:hypothetical protein
MSKVIIVAHPTTGALFTPTANPDWVKCQLRSTSIGVNNGVVASINKVAFPLISKSVADTLVTHGLKAGSVFPVEGKIIRKQSRVPFFEGQNPVSQKDGTVIMYEGAEYYQQYEFTADMSQADDQRIGAPVAANVEVKENF